MVYGDVVEGEVRAGMLLQVPLNPQQSLDAPVVAVEFIDGTPSGSHVALAFSLAEPLDLATWHELNIGDVILEVLDPDGHAA